MNPPAPDFFRERLNEKLSDSLSAFIIMRMLRQFRNTPAIVIEGTQSTLTGSGPVHFLAVPPRIGVRHDETSPH